MRPSFDFTEAPFGRRHQHHGFGPGRGGRGGPGGPRGGRRGRAPRGDVRAAILLLLADEPMHGYQLMQAIADRTDGRWTPSPGAIYPAISLLEDEGLVVAHAESGRKVVTLTDAGQALVEEHRATWPDPFDTAANGPAGPDLRSAVMQLGEAARQVGRTGSPEQRERAAAIIDDARRALYLLLADGPERSEA